MTAFETVQEEEDKIQTSLFLITDSWWQAFILYKPLDSSWSGKHISWGKSLLCSPLHLLRIKGTCLHIVYLALVGRKSQVWGQQCYLSLLGYHLLEIPFPILSVQSVSLRWTFLQAVYFFILLFKSVSQFCVFDWRILSLMVKVIIAGGLTTAILLFCCFVAPMFLAAYPAAFFCEDDLLYWCTFTFSWSLCNKFFLWLPWALSYNYDTLF